MTIGSVDGEEYGVGLESRDDMNYYIGLKEKCWTHVEKIKDQIVAK
ncbi:MAG: hypothetical protein NTNFB02_11000 [Nitrospira sp.]